MLVVASWIRRPFLAYDPAMAAEATQKTHTALRLRSRSCFRIFSGCRGAELPLRAKGHDTIRSDPWGRAVVGGNRSWSTGLGRLQLFLRATRYDIVPIKGIGIG
jgi:hypothetical protein